MPMHARMHAVSAAPAASGLRRNWLRCRTCIYASVHVTARHQDAAPAVMRRRR